MIGQQALNVEVTDSGLGGIFSFDYTKVIYSIILLKEYLHKFNKYKNRVYCKLFRDLMKIKKLHRKLCHVRVVVTIN